MMHQSINKKKIYLYIFIFLFLSTSYNLNLSKNFNQIGLIKSIDIIGLSKKEEILIKEELKTYLNSNVFLLNKDLILKSLNQFNFLEKIIVKKIFPSKLEVNLKKTKFLGTTIIDGRKYYIGSNGMFTKSDQINNENNLPLVFGNFQINDFLELQNNLKKQNINLNQIDKYFFYKNKRWDLQINGGLLLKLPSKDLNNSLKIYKKLIENNDLHSIKIIDLRMSNQIILTDEKK